MANRSFLVANASNTPAEFGEEGQLNYGEDEILVAASYGVPVLWLVLFNEADIRQHEIDGETISSPVIETKLALERFKRRRSLLESTFSNYTMAIEEWSQLLNSLSEPHIKIDGIEIWEMGPEEYEEKLVAAIRWFETNDGNDFDQLLQVTGLPYDKASASIESGSYAPETIHNGLRGYVWTRSVPWSD
ncbi:MAG: hypothetical protein AAF085_12585 [Planctomycetota bacterium]